MGELPPPPAEPARIVRPRKLRSGSIPLAVVWGDVVWSERTDETIPLDDWIDGLESEPAGLVACELAGRLLERVHARWFDHPRWQFKLIPTEEPVTQGAGAVVRTLVGFFGFAGKAPGKKHVANRYFYPLDPLQFGRSTVDELRRDTELPFAALWRWAHELRDFCESMGIKPTVTRGSVAKQLLTHPRFYPEARRKVPTATNNKTRPRLPGNHYELLADRSRIYSALYLDQRSAHHTIAGSIPLPHADRLQARGHFHTLRDMPWAAAGSERFDQVTAEHGLLYGRVSFKPSSRRTLVPEWAVRGGSRLVYLYTNELRLLDRLGGRLEYVVAAWTSPDRDKGIARYARWAKRRIDRADPAERRWLKPTLLTAYGMLATRPRRMTAGWWRASGGVPDMFPLGRDLIAVRVKIAAAEGEPSTNNVVQRGMIEAEMRARSLELAWSMEAQGRQVLSVYADAIMVRAKRHEQLQLGWLPEGWAVKSSLHLLRFLDESRFTSQEMVRLPGVRRDSPIRQQAAGGRRSREHPRDGDERGATARVADRPPAMVALAVQRSISTQEVAQ